MPAELAVFYALAAFALVSGAWVVLSPRSVGHSAVCLGACLLSLSALSLLLGAPLLAALQLLAGVAMVTVLLLFAASWRTPPSEPWPVGRRIPVRVLGVGLALALAGLLYASLPAELPTALPAALPGSADPSAGSEVAIGARLFTRAAVPLQALSLLLLAAMIAAITLSRRKDES